MKHKWLIASILFVIEVALCGGMVLASSTGISRLQQEGVRVRFFQFDTFSAEADQEQSFTVGLPARLVVANSIGQLTVQAGSDNAIVVHMHKKAWGSSPSEAQVAVAALKPDLSQNGNTVTINPPVEPEKVVVFGSSRSSSIDLTITVPISTAVTARNSFGSITLSGTAGEIDLRSNNGSVHATDIAGNVNLRSTFGDVTVERVTAGAFTAGSNNGALTLTDIKADGAVELTDSFGSITCNGGSGMALDVRTSNGAVTLTHISVHGTVTATNSFGNLTLNQVQATSYKLHTNNGKISVDGASGTLQAQSDMGDVEVVHGSGVSLDLHSNNGSLAFNGSLGSGPNTLSTSFGDVRLNLPRDSALTVDLKTNMGQLQSEFPMTQTGVINDKHWSGTLNGGGSRLTASSNNGSIYLNILNP